MTQILLQPVRVGDKEIRDQRALIRKLAAGSATDGGYESTVAQLGMRAVQDRVPALMPYFKGFQLLDVNDDGDQAVGFFIFEMGGRVIDAPVFLRDGEIKGKELLFLRDRQAFMPSQKGLVEYVIGLQQQPLGEAGPAEGDSRRKRVTPSIDVFSRANSFLHNKVSQYPQCFDDWGRESGVFESYVSMYKHASTKEILSGLVNERKMPSPDFKTLFGFDGVIEKLAAWCQASPKLASRVQARFGDDWQEKYTAERKKLRSPLAKKASFSIGNTGSTPFAASPICAESAHIQMSENIPKLASADVRSRATEEIAQWGAAFYDRRSPEQCKKAMGVEFDNTTFHGVTDTERAWVPMRDGKTQKCWVIVPRHRVGVSYNDNADKVLVIGDEGAAWCYAADLTIKAKEGFEPISEMRDITDEGESFTPSSVSKGTAFVLVDKHGHVTDPMESEGSNGDGELRVRYCHLATCGRRPENQDGYAIPRTGYSLDCDNSVDVVAISETTSSFSYVDSGETCRLMVPKETKIIRLKTAAKSDTEEKSELCCPNLPVGEPVAALSILPSSAMDDDSFRKIADFTVQTRSHGRTVRLDGHELLTKNAAFTLMDQYGLSKEGALQLLRDSEPNRTHHFAVVPTGAEVEEPWQLVTSRHTKVAYSMRPDERPSYQFRFPERDFGQSDSVIPVTEEYPNAEVDRAPVDFASSDDPDWSGQDAPYEEPRVTGDVGGGLSDGIGAAKAQNSLWENKLFESLLRHARADTQISSQIKALFQVADTTGRTLFLMYAHREDFEDLFGRRDFADMEEQMITLFESSGDLIADLLQESADSTNDAIFLAVENN